MVAYTKQAWRGFHPSGDANVPARLSVETRNLAKRFISGDVGRSMMTVEQINKLASEKGKPMLEIPPEFYLDLPSEPKIYARAIREIAEKAPLRILDGEKFVGAATIYDARKHKIPALGIASVSHITIGFEKALRIGCDGLRDEITERLNAGGLDADGTDLLHAMLDCLDSLTIWKNRYYGDALRRGLFDIAETIARVPEYPPANFREGVQALWLLWDFHRLCGNWSGIGRIDKMLGPLLADDLQRGAITLDEAREYLAHFWIKGCEWINGESGDSNLFQNIILSGVDEEGNDITNEATYLVLDIVEELHIGDFPIAVRLNSKSSPRLYQRVAQVQRMGGGIVAVYNEDVIIDALVKYGYPLSEARDFANDGCWEVLIPGKTAFTYQNFDALQILQDTLGLNGECQRPVHFETFEALYEDYRIRFAKALTEQINQNKLFGERRVTVLMDIFVEDCIKNARSYYNSGPKYTVVSPHPSGLPDVVNSLLCIDKYVFRDKKFSLSQLVEYLKNNWEGAEDVRRDIREHGEFYGNDSEEADKMLQRVYDDYIKLMSNVSFRNGALRPAGISTFEQIAGRDFLEKRTASAQGSRKGDILALNFSPTPGTDRKGPTAVIKSHCSVDYSKLPCGTALELKLSPASIRSSNGDEIIASLLRSFIKLGGMFMQLDLVDTELLKKAKEHPEDHPNLVVRVSGWSARFATMREDWQEMVMQRTEQRA